MKREESEMLKTGKIMESERVKGVEERKKRSSGFRGYNIQRTRCRKMGKERMYQETNIKKQTKGYAAFLNS